ncbi:MAG: HAD family phosphatase [Pseudomonadota bacterium]
MDLSHISAIIFDNDGVLVDSEAIHVAVERELLAEMGLIYDQSSYMSRFVGLSSKDFEAALAGDHQVRLGTLFPNDFRARLDARVWPRMEAELLALPGITGLVQQFGGKVAVASSAEMPRLIQKLQLTALYDVFAPHIYSSDHVEKGKPAPDLFLHAAAKLSAEPSGCMVVEDSVNGIKAARAAGMLPVGFVGGGHADPDHAARLRAAGAKLVLDSHMILLDWFKRA